MLRDNQQLESNLRSLATSDPKYLELEKERDQLKWNQERLELQARLKEYDSLLKARDQEVTHQKLNVERLMRDEIESLEQDHADKLEALEAALRESEDKVRRLQGMWADREAEEGRARRLLGSMVFNLGISERQEPRRDWLGRNRKQAYSIKSD